MFWAACVMDATSSTLDHPKGATQPAVREGFKLATDGIQFYVSNVKLYEPGP